MKNLILTIFIVLFGLFGYSQTASQLIPTQGLNPKPNTPPNFLYVNTADNRIWPVLSDSLRFKPINIQWLNDSVIVIGDRRWVKLAGNYSNPNFINSLAASKVTGLATVATTGDYNSLTNRPVIPSAQIQSDWNQSNNTLADYIKNKPNLSVYETLSNASATYYPNTNPNGYISSFTEVDPIWIGDKPNYRTKVQNDALYQPIGSYLTSETDPTVSAYAKSLTAFSVIKASTDPLYRPITYVPDTSVYRTVANSLTLAQLQTKLNGYVPNTRTITINGTTFDLSANRIFTVGDVTSASLSSTLSNYVLTSTYTAGLATKQNALTLTTTGTGVATLTGATLNIPTPVNNTYTAGTGISIASNVITNTSPDQVVSIASGTGISVTGSYPAFTATNTAPYVPPVISTPTMVLGTSYQAPANKNVWVNCSITHTIALTLVLTSGSSSVQLQTSVNGTTWVTINSCGFSDAVAIAVALNKTVTNNVSGEVPPNYYYRLLATTSGAGTAAIANQQLKTY